MKTIPIWKLHKHLIYHCESGKFYWRIPHAAVSAGDEAGCIQKEYRLIKVGGLQFRAGRLAYAMHYGFFPSDLIDHINGDRDDNRIANLRVATHRDNARNQVSHRNGKLTGICRYPSGRWCARKEKRHVGMFDTIEQAQAALKASGV